MGTSSNVGHYVRQHVPDRVQRPETQVDQKSARYHGATSQEMKTGNGRTLAPIAEPMRLGGASREHVVEACPTAVPTRSN